MFVRVYLRVLALCTEKFIYISSSNLHERSVYMLQLQLFVSSIRVVFILLATSCNS